MKIVRLTPEQERSMKRRQALLPYLLEAAKEMEKQSHDRQSLERNEEPRPKSSRKKATQESRELRRRLKTAEAIEEVLAGVTGGTVHQNGEIELGEHDAEVIRRLMAERHYQRTGSETNELPFDGMVFSPRQLDGLAKFGKGKGRELLKESGYTDEDLKGYDELMKTLGTIAKDNKGHTVVFVYEDALPYSRFQREELEAGRVTANGRERLKERPLWNTEGTAFDRAYPNVNDADKASQLAAILATGAGWEYGLDRIPNFEEEKDKFLSIWARDIAKNVIKRIGVEEWEKKFPIIAALAAEKRMKVNAVIQTSSASRKLTMQEWCKLHGIPWEDTTAQHVGESSVHFSTQPRQSSESDARQLDCSPNTPE